MSDVLQKHLGLPPIDQLGFVVKNLTESMTKYEALFGPFDTMDGSVEGADFRGQSKDVNLKLAFGRSGDLEIELIEWVSGESPHSEFIRAGNEGMHHIRYRVDDCDDCIRLARTIGFEQIWYKVLPGEIKFAYLERENDPLIIEFLQMPGGYPSD
jgi:methylmalonyl-CoA/ethylmalonyl-CoA epimerase